MRSLGHVGFGVGPHGGGGVAVFDGESSLIVAVETNLPGSKTMVKVCVDKDTCLRLAQLFARAAAGTYVHDTSIPQGDIDCLGEPIPQTGGREFYYDETQEPFQGTQAQEGNQAGRPA